MNRLGQVKLALMEFSDQLDIFQKIQRQTLDDFIQKLKQEKLEEIKKG